MTLNIKAYFKLSRPANLLLVGTVVLIASTLFQTYPSIWDVLLTIICATFITAAGNALNDMCDIEIDRINKPNRPLPSGKISIKNAKRFMIIMFILGNIAGLILGFWSFVCCDSALVLVRLSFAPCGIGGEYGCGFFIGPDLPFCHTSFW